MNQPEDFRRQAPAPLPARPMHIPTAHETTLSNGLTLVIVEDKRLPLVSYRLAFRTGDAHDPKGLPGLTDMMSGLLTEGTQSRTSRQIAEEVERMGATLHAGASSDYTTVSASALSVFGDKILELMAIDATTRDRLVEFHQSAFVPNNAVFIVAGDVERPAIVECIEKLFGSWQSAEAKQDEFPSPPARACRAAYLVDRPGSAQSNIVIANTAITRTSPDYFPMLLMHTVLGANASSRLFMNLREVKGYTYGAYSSLDARRTAGTFRTSAEVRTPVTSDSLREFFYELKRIRTEPVSEKEIADAKSYLTGVFPIRLETQEGLIDQLVQIRMLGLPDDYLETYRDRVQAVTIEQIRVVAQKYVKPDEAAIVVVGDGAQVIEQLKPYSGAIEIYNTAGKRKEATNGSSSSAGTKVGPAAFAGTWALEIQTPFGQNIPATLRLEQESNGFRGKVESEMGEGELVNVSLEGNQFQASLSFDLEGHPIEAQITGAVDRQQIDGSISLQDSPPLPFTGNRAE